MGIDSRPMAPVTFTKPVAKRIADAVRRVEKTPYWHGAAGAAYAPGYGTIFRATVTTAIPTGSIGAPSTAGQATLYRWDPAAMTSTIETNPDFVNVTVCNDHGLSAPIAVSKTIKVAWIDGNYWLIAADC